MDDETNTKEQLAGLRAEVARLERRVAELDALAHADPLVPLPNRRGLMSSLDKSIARHERYGERCAILFIDVDGLKEINDAHGHAAGDAALIAVAEAMLAGTRKGDTVARLGGDEFCILLERADEERAHEIAQRLVETLGDEFCDQDGKPVTLSMSIGVTTLEKGDLPKDALARADAAMYESKRSGSRIRTDSRG